MGQSKKVKLGNRASIFFDIATGIKVLSGQIVELTESQFSKSSIKRALANGYLVEVKGEVKVDESDGSMDVRSRFDKMISERKNAENIKDAFSLKELKALAITFDIEPEEGDTKSDLVKAIFEEVTNTEE